MIFQGMFHGDEETLFSERQAYMIYVEFGKRVKKKNFDKNKSDLHGNKSVASRLLFIFFCSSLRETFRSHTSASYAVLKIDGIINTVIKQITDVFVFIK